jgi:hypothetical protein
VAATGPDSLVALVVRDWNLYRVEITVVGPPAAGAPAMAP